METFSPRKRAATPTDYEFPFEPYEIQQKLMEAVYRTLTQKGIGIFESPTGTGKSLTLTCAVLRWLEDHENSVRRDLSERIRQLEQEVQRLNIDTNTASDWITVSFELSQQRKELMKLRQLHRLLLEYEERLHVIRQRHAEKQAKQQKPLKANENFSSGIAGNLQWEEAEISETLSDDDEKKERAPKVEEEMSKYRPIQIFFCSRTHSQLTQVVNEVKRSAYGRRVRCISLASRQQLCINPQIRRLSSASLINERCIDMAQSAKESGNYGAGMPLRKHTNNAKIESKCCMFRKVAAVQQLSETALVQVLDIEDLVKEGEVAAACPYYATRDALQSAQLVMLPYQMLLHRRTRLQMGIDLRGAVIVIDEAHNLLDTIAQLHSCELTLLQLISVQQQLSAYKMHYAKRFSTANLLRINQLLFVTKRMTELLQAKSKEAGKPKILRTYELTTEGEFYNINLVELLEFCERSRLAQKLQGFADLQNHSGVTRQNESAENRKSGTQGFLQQLQSAHEHSELKYEKKLVTNILTDDNVEGENLKSSENNQNVKITATALRQLLAFIETLTENAEDGRVLLHIDAFGDPANSTFKYILLNPGSHFDDIVRVSRAIIIAGGTMQPTAELTDQLFRSCMDRVQLHFYDHVVDSNAVLPFVVAQGPTGRRVCFNYAQRNSKEMLVELGMILQNICHVVPAGLVCFMPSYEYLDTVYKHLQQSGILARISTKKRIFCEPRSTTSTLSIEKLLADYSMAINSENRGALLLSVVGGKLSEGLNFADDLGRGVMVVGMPYPNLQSLELQERMKYLDTIVSPGVGNEYYENLCMKAINQCIGRSVRHIKDYACVFLVDERYGRVHIQKKLPNWIERSLQIPTSFGVIQASTARFFKQKKMYR